MSEPRPEAARWLAAAEEELATARHLAAGTPAEAFSAAQAQRALGHAEAVVEAARGDVSPP